MRALSPESFLTVFPLTLPAAYVHDSFGAELLDPEATERGEAIVRRAAGLTVSLLLALSFYGSGLTAHAARNASTLRYADLLTRGYMVGDTANFDRMKQAAIDATERSHPGTFLPAASAHHPSASPSFQGSFDTAGEPPDTTGTAGPSRFVEAENSRIDVFSRKGAHLGGATFDAVLGPCVTTAAQCEYSDPQVLWDQQTQRFYYEDLNADIGGSANFLAWGFSKTANPNTFGSTDWCNYSTQTGLNYGTSLPDYPKMGASTDFLMIGVNVYAGETYTGSDIDTISKPQSASPITSCPAPGSFTYTRNGPISDCDPSGVFAANPNPAQQAETTPDGWVVADPDPTNSGFSANWVDVIHITKNPGTGAPVVGAAVVRVGAPVRPAAAGRPEGGTSDPCLHDRHPRRPHHPRRHRHRPPHRRIQVSPRALDLPHGPGRRRFRGRLVRDRRGARQDLPDGRRERSEPVRLQRRHRERPQRRRGEVRQQHGRRLQHLGHRRVPRDPDGLEARGRVRSRAS